MMPMFWEMLEIDGDVDSGFNISNHDTAMIELTMEGP